MVLPLMYFIGLDLEANKPVTPTLVLFDKDEEWLKCICEHTTPELKVYVVGEDDNDVEIQAAHIVFAFYEQLFLDFDSFRQIKWRRVILTDVHDGFAQELSDKVALLKSKRKWVVTRKPILIEYMGFIFSFFNLELGLVVEKLLTDRFVEFEPLIKSTAEGITLRRTKVDIGILPAIEEHNYRIELSREDQNKYDLIVEEAVVVLRRYKKNKNEGPTLLPYLKTLIPPLRQLALCTDLLLDRLKDQFRDVSKSKEPKLKQKVMELQKGGLTCPICLSNLIDCACLITSCAHIFCRKCIREALEANSKSNCPFCRREGLSDNELFSVAPPPLAPESSNIASSSAKVEVLVKLLTEHKSQNGKFVVFSLFPTVLALLESTLSDAGFKTMGLYEINMDGSYKDKVIEQFKASEEEKPMIVLVSIEAGRDKFDLKVASTVFLMEACKQKAEKCAIKCVQQIGRKEAVKVVRIIAKNTIEENILELHELSMRPKESQETWYADRILFNEIDFILEGYPDDM